MIVRKVTCKSTFRTSKFFRVIMQVKSNIVFEVMFYIDEDFNNSRKYKNTILKSVPY